MCAGIFFLDLMPTWTKRKNYFFWDSLLFCICLVPLVSASQVATILIEFAHTETQKKSKSSESSFWHRYCFASVLELHSNRYTATTIFTCQEQIFHFIWNLHCFMSFNDFQFCESRCVFKMSSQHRADMVYKVHYIYGCLGICHCIFIFQIWLKVKDCLGVQHMWCRCVCSCQAMALTVS